MNRSHSDERPRGPSGSAAGSLHRIWSRLARPINPVMATETLLGLNNRTTRQLIGALTAGSPEATKLIREMPQIIRSLSISTITVPERTVGSVRGPIMWSETMAARSSAGGDTGIFVCSTSMRAYDTPENRVLVTALHALRTGGREVEHFHRRGTTEPPLFAAARRNGGEAARFLEHRALSGVQPIRRRGRTAGRIRVTGRRRAYLPAVAMFDKAAEPVGVDDLRSLADGRTTAQHDLVVALVDALSTRGVRIGAFHLDHGTLVAGPVRYRHPDHANEDHPGGLVVGDLLIDVATRHAGEPGDDDEDLAARAGDRASLVVRGRGDIAKAADQVLRAGLLSS